MRNCSITKERFIEALDKSVSIREIVINLGWKYGGSGANRIKKLATKYDINLDEYLGKRHIRTAKGTKKNKLSIKDEDIFIEYSDINKAYLRRRYALINPPDSCYICKLTEWLNKPISLQLDHINGNHTDNRLDNLRWLCPNCHSQTESYTRSLETRGYKFPKDEDLLDMHQNLSNTEIADTIGCSTTLVSLYIERAKIKKGL